MASKHTLRILAMDAEPWVRAIVAENRTTPRAMLQRKFAGDPDRTVRLVVARSGRTSRTTLIKLATDTDDRVRLAIALRARTPSAALGILVNDPEERVRMAVIKRATTPRAILVARLLSESNPATRTLIRQVLARRGWSGSS